MKATHPVCNRLFVDQPIPDASEKSNLLQLADQAEREGWIDTTAQLALVLCLIGSMLICGFRVAAPTAASTPKDSTATTQPAATTLVVGAHVTKATPSL